MRNDFAHRGNAIHEVDGQTNGFALIGERTFDGLFNPPGGVGAEFATFARVEAFDCFDEADVTLADEVEQLEAKVVVLVGNLDN